MERSQLKVVRSLLMGAVFALACTAIVARQGQAITVNLKPNAAEGAGYGVVLMGAASDLSVTLAAPAGWQITESQIRDSGCALWGPPNGDPAPPTQTQTYQALGIGRNDDHSVGFTGKLSRASGGGGTVPTFDVAVADVQIAGHELEPSDGIAICFPPMTPPAEAGTLNISVTLRAPSSCPDPAGTLTLSWSGNGAAGIEHLSHNGVVIPNGGSIQVPKDGLFNEPFAVTTNESFTDSATITATFNWAPSIAASSPSSVRAYIRSSISRLMIAVEAEWPQ